MNSRVLTSSGRRAGGLPWRGQATGRESGAGPAMRSPRSPAGKLLIDAGEMTDGGPAAGNGSHADGRGKLQFGAQGQFALRIAGRVPAEQGPNCCGVVGGDNHKAAFRGRADQGRGIEPPPDGILPALRFSRRSSESPSSRRAAA